MNKTQKREFYECIQGSAMPEHHKTFVFEALKEIFKPKPQAAKIRRVKTAAPLVLLSVWEALHGALHYSMLREWVQKKGYCPKTIVDLIEEFRTEMQSKGKEYADFRAAFQTYLTKGYLSKKPEQALWANSPHRKQENVRTTQRGMSI